MTMSDTRRPRVVVLDDYEGAVGASSHFDAIHERIDLRAVRMPLDRDALADAVAEAPIVVTLRERTRLDRAHLAAMADTELILQTGGHAYHVDVAAATDEGIAISLGRGSRSPAPVVAEIVFGLLIDHFRGLTPAINAMRAGGWPATSGRSLYGKVLGVLGLGRHGVSVARLGRAFGMEVVAWGPTLTDDRAAAEHATRLDLDELLAVADVVSINLRLSPSSTGLIGAEQLALLKPHAVLVNTSRGPIVDESALVDALRRETFGGALLDVFDEEPLPRSHPLRSLPNVIATPHLGYTVDVAFDDFAATSAQQLTAYLDGRLGVEHLLNPEVVDRASRRFGGFRSPRDDANDP